MKKFLLLVSFSCIVLLSSAQVYQQQPINEKRHQDIEALKVAFISRELELTPEEAQRFWPLYNQYTIELNETIGNTPDVLLRDERVLNLRKRYSEQFVRIIGPERLNRMFGAEERFHQLLIRAMRRQQMEGNRPGGRPYMRRVEAL
jgi:hypothetical protein